MRLDFPQRLIDEGMKLYERQLDHAQKVWGHYDDRYCEIEYRTSKWWDDFIQCK